MQIVVKMFRNCFLVFLLVAGPAFADMDYKCLADCKNNGGVTQACMTQCNYTAPTGLSKAKRPPGTAHNEFSAPVAVDATIVPEKMAVSTESSNPPNMQCVQACMKEKLQYSLCEKRCVPEK